MTGCRHVAGVDDLQVGHDHRDAQFVRMKAPSRVFPVQEAPFRPWSDLIPHLSGNQDRGTTDRFPRAKLAAAVWQAFDRRRRCRRSWSRKPRGQAIRAQHSLPIALERPPHSHVRETIGKPQQIRENGGLYECIVIQEPYPFRSGLERPSRRSVASCAKTTIFACGDEEPLSRDIGRDGGSECLSGAMIGNVD